MNIFGNIYTLTSFGESHGAAVGGVVDGLPAGTLIDLGQMRRWVDRRRPGGSALSTRRREGDCVRILSGLMAAGDDGRPSGPLLPDTVRAVALGTPVGFLTENTDARAADYEELRHVYRPSHADYAWDERYGHVRDWRGGGRSSGRETFARVVAGAFAIQWLGQRGVGVSSRIAAIGGVVDPTDAQVEAEIVAARSEADSVGGILECRVTGMPPGVGEPVFGKLQQMLASAVMSVGGVKGFEYGMGFGGVCGRGSALADGLRPGTGGKPVFVSNHSGGIQGGISNGNEICFRVAVKPTPTIGRPLPTMTDSGEPAVLAARGRHDPSILVRVPVVIESMCAMVLMDAMLLRAATAPAGAGAQPFSQG